jgi:hypothetical protein
MKEAPMNKRVLSDATVKFDDCLRWVETLYHTRSDEVIRGAMAVEPAVLLTALDLARQTCRRLEKEGWSEESREYITRQIVLTGAICIELMRQGQAALWDDLISPDSDEPQGDHHA